MAVFTWRGIQRKGAEKKYALSFSSKLLKGQIKHLACKKVLSKGSYELTVTCSRDLDHAGLILELLNGITRWCRTVQRGLQDQTHTELWTSSPIFTRALTGNTRAPCPTEADQYCQRATQAPLNLMLHLPASTTFLYQKKSSLVKFQMWHFFERLFPAFPPFFLIFVSPLKSKHTMSQVTQKKCYGKKNTRKVVLALSSSSRCYSAVRDAEHEVQQFSTLGYSLTADLSSWADASSAGVSSLQNG